MLHPRPDTQHFQPPFHLPNSEIGGVIFLEGSPGKLQAELVDPILNLGGTTGRFELIVPGMAIAVFGHYPEVSTTGPEWGEFNYNEANLVLPVKDNDNVGKYYLFFPVMMLDAFLPLVCGREIYGIPKVAGRFDRTWTNSAWSVDAEVEGFTTKSKSETAGWREVFGGRLSTALVAYRVNPDPCAIKSFLCSLPIPDPDEAFGLDIKEGWEWMIKFLAGDFSMEAIYLKQFPECDNIGNASYQELVVSEFKATAIHSFAAGLGSVTIHNPASYPLGDAVGHSSDPSIVPGLAFAVRMDWTMGAGTILP